MDEQQIESKATSLGFTIERGSGSSHYQLKDPNGQIVLLGSLKKIDAALDGHLRKKAEALGLRLSAKKVSGTSFDELSSGEARAVQREATTGYKIDKRVVIIDRGQAGEDRKQREDLAQRGGQNIEWVTVLGPDHTATLAEVIDYLNEYAADVGLDDTAVEGGAPVKGGLSKAEFEKAIVDHPNSGQIRATRGVKPRPDSEAQRRQQAIDDFLSLRNSSVRWGRVPPEEKRRLLANYEKLKAEDERANDAKNFVKKKQPTWAELERQEEQRKKRAFRKGDLLLKRTNIRSGFDWKDDDHKMALLNGQDPNKARQEMIRSGIKEWQNASLPDQGASDFSTPKANATPQVVAKKSRVSKADMTKQRALHDLAKTINETNDRPTKRAALIEAKATLDQHGGWLDWLSKHTTLSVRAAQRLME
jgi:hypothetical protein